ncbi:MAG: glutamate racemase [Bacteroidetes bacterium]|nr:glutamate racemase [Bacteroidota bacterium]MBP7398483.1 glutamate racemase [Chitinophagales bacterium]MBK7107962.1 glutamate racemase [Bacteroidota bacterium]MBK8486606.1 glutamate racemase [Bacteroidota bacterium]MBK8683387.1 glutamate racemase [Bacteroidota bacterium]
MSDRKSGPIGVFDSGYGGLTILKEIVKTLPQYDYIYLGDNARAPYGNRSFETVYEFTWQHVKNLFGMGCQLVLLACNTASAKALRNIQQKNLPATDSKRRVLGVIRPTAEIVGEYSTSGNVGVFATEGTVRSGTYIIEIQHFFPELQVFQQACPMWVPIVENNEIESEGATFFIKEYIKELLAQSNNIDTIVLGCTHYPLLQKQIKKYLPSHIQLISQDSIVAKSLADYLIRHPEIETVCSKEGTRTFYTTDDAENFDKHAKLFFGSEIKSKVLHI